MDMHVEAMRTKSQYRVAMAALLLVLFGCTEGKRPFLTVQLCVHDRAGATELVSDLKDLATEKHMEFFDSSAVTAKDLTTTGYRGRERSDGSPMINVGLLRQDGLGVGGGNLGLPGYQVALGFSKGSDDAESRRFADDTVKVLERRWRVEVLPAGSAAKPKADCN